MHRDSGNMPAVASCVGARGELLRESGELEAALETFSLAADIYRSLNMQRALAGELAREAGVLSLLGRYGEALERTAAAAAIARELGDQRVLANNELFRAEDLLRRGELEAALSLAKEVEAMGREHGGVLEAAGALRLRGEIHASRGEAIEALHCFDESAAMARNAGDVGTQAFALCRKGQALAAQSPKAARNTLREAAEVLKGGTEQRSELQFEILAALARAEQALGENAAATARRACEIGEKLYLKARPNLKAELEAMRRLAGG